MIDTVSVQFGEHDPEKMANELRRSRYKVNNYVLDVLKKSPHDEWYYFRVYGAGWFRRNFIMHRYRIMLEKNLSMTHTNDGSTPSYVYSHRIMKHNSPRGQSVGSWKTIYKSVTDLLEDHESLTLEYVIREIKRQATILAEKHLTTICQHTAAMDETKTHDEIIEELNNELRFHVVE